MRALLLLPLYMALAAAAADRAGEVRDGGEGARGGDGLVVDSQRAPTTGLQVARLFALVDKNGSGDLDCAELNFPDCAEQLGGGVVKPEEFDKLLVELAEANGVPSDKFLEGALRFQTQGTRMKLEEMRPTTTEPREEDFVGGDPDEDEGGRDLR